jgi:hypothetical protein
VGIVHWDRKGRKAAAAAKSRRLTGPRCSGELQGGWPEKAACGSSGSGMDKRGRGKRETGRRPTFILKNRLGGAGRDRGAWRCGRQHGVAGNGPRPSGMGDAVVAEHGRAVGRG